MTWGSFLKNSNKPSGGAGGIVRDILVRSWSSNEMVMFFGVVILIAREKEKKGVSFSMRFGFLG